MQDFLFYLFGALAIGCGFLVVANPFSRNPVTSAMFLVLMIVSLAGLFVLLQAFFLAAVQVLVYAGAVIVLFLFVIMLLDLKEEVRRRFKMVTVASAVLAIGSLAFILVRAIWGSQFGSAANRLSVRGETAPLGRLLFTEYLLPF